MTVQDAPRTLTYSDPLALWVIDEDPDLLVLGFVSENENKFLWINGDIGDAQHPEVVERALGDQADYETVVSAALGPGKALTLSQMTLYHLTGMPLALHQPWQVLAETVNATI